MAPALQEYAEFLERYTEFLETMAKDQTDRYEAMVSFDADALSHAMAGLQSGMMQLEQMEEKRMSLQRTAGFGDDTFAQILQKLPAEDRSPMEDLFRRIRIAVWDIKFLNEKALTFAREGVSSMRVERIDPQHNLYTRPVKGGKQAGGSSIFDMNY